MSKVNAENETIEPASLSVAKRNLYFSDSTSSEVRENAYSIFCEVWKKMPKEDQQIIEEHLEFIIIKPVNDPLLPDTVAFTRASATYPTWMSWVMWYPFPLALKRKINLFSLANELAHVCLQHPQQGLQMTREEEKEFKNKAEDEANEQVSKWNVQLPTDNR
jgi:hypothetical protein